MSNKDNDGAFDFGSDGDNQHVAQSGGDDQYDGEPKSKPAKKKMGIGKKILIGVGAFALLILLAVAKVMIQGGQQDQKPVESSGDAADFIAPATHDQKVIDVIAPAQSDPVSAVSSIEPASSVAPVSVESQVVIAPTTTPTQDRSVDAATIANLEQALASEKSKSSSLQNRLDNANPVKTITKIEYRDRYHTVKSKCEPVKELKLTPDTASKSVEQVVSVATPTQVTVEPIKNVEVASAVVVAQDPVAQAPVRSICEFKGSLVNRAWLVCDGKLLSAVKGDPLPFPYMEVLGVTDSESSGGSVLTRAGTLQ